MENINYYEKLGSLTNLVCSEILENLKRINKDEITEEDNFTTFHVMGDENTKIAGINKDGYVLIETEGGDYYQLYIQDDSFVIQDLIYILEELRVL